MSQIKLGEKIVGLLAGKTTDPEIVCIVHRYYILLHIQILGKTIKIVRNISCSLTVK